MARVAYTDWQVGELVVVPHAWRDDHLWSDIQAETQGRIGADLRTMYADLLRQPLSSPLSKLAREVERRMEAPRHDG